MEPGSLCLLLLTVVPDFITHVQMDMNLIPVAKDRKPKGIKRNKRAKPCVTAPNYSWASHASSHGLHSLAYPSFMTVSNASNLEF